ncbi:MAG: hypothetical protein AABY22_12885 [Nanoarchaeota archaeon]
MINNLTSLLIELGKNGFQFKEPQRIEVDGEMCFSIIGHGLRRKSYISIDQYEDCEIIGYSTSQKTKVFEHPHNFNEIFEELMRELND